MKVLYFWRSIEIYKFTIVITSTIFKKLSITIYSNNGNYPNKPIMSS
jgi:hypothetical protein